MKSLFQVSIVVTDKNGWIFSYNKQVWTVSDDAAQLKVACLLAEELQGEPVKVKSIKVIEVK